MNTDIQIPVAALKAVLPGLAKVLPRHTALPVLQCVKIALDAEGKTIQLQAHGLDEVATVRLENKAAGTPGQLLVPFEMLSKIIKGCASDQAIGFIGSKGQTTLRYNVGMSSVDRVVSYVSPDEWPEVKAIGQESIILTEPFKAVLKEALECASEDSSRYVLNGACLDVTDKASHYVVGTDGRHLYSANSFHFSLPESLILPTRKFPTWPGFVNDGPWKLRMAPAIRVDPQQKEKSTEQDQPAWFQIESDRWTYLAKAIDGKFPNWRQCVPTFDQDWTRVELQPAAIKVILEAVPLLPGADYTNEPIRLEVGERLTLRARGKDQSQDTRVPIAEVKVAGKPVEVSLNRGYLMKALRFGLNQVDIREPLDPVRFSCGGKSMVVMPLRMDPEPAKAPGEPEAEAAPEPTPSTETTPAAPPSAPEAVTSTDTERKTVTENTMPQRGNLKSHTNPTTNGNGNGNGEESRSGFKAVLEQLDQIKTSLRQVLSDLNEATSALKAAEKEQRANTKEIEAVRAKLREIQSVAI